MENKNYNNKHTKHKYFIKGNNIFQLVPVWIIRHICYVLTVPLLSPFLLYLSEMMFQFWFKNNTCQGIGFKNGFR